MDLPDNPTLQFLIQWGYWIAIPVMIVEGPIATMVMAFFASFGYFSWLVVLIVSLLADLVSDIIFYLIGYFRGEGFIRRFGKWFGLTPRSHEVLSNYYREHGGKSIFIAKILTGVVPPMFITAGYSRMNFKRFLFFATLGGLVWSAALVTIGYRFGAQLEGNFVNIVKVLETSGVVFAILLLLLVLYKFYFSPLIRKKMHIFFNKTDKPESTNEKLFPSDEDKTTTR